MHLLEIEKKRISAAKVRRRGGSASWSEHIIIHDESVPYRRLYSGLRLTI